MGVQHSDDGRPLPLPNPTTQPYFDGARERKLRMQRCPRDGFFFYPRSHCPSCLGVDWSWRETSGRGTVHSFTVDRIGHVPALRAVAPFAIAIVELEEGPRLTARLVDVDADRVEVGLTVEAAYEDVDEMTLVHFRPVR